MVSINLYGPISSTYEYVKLLLQRQIELYSIDASIIEKQEIDHLISDGISSVPAVRINNGETMYINEIKDSMDFVQSVVKKLIKMDDQTNKLKIVVPIDLSDASINALEYAINLARTCKGQIKVVHFYHPVVTEIDGNVYIDPKEEELRRESFEKFINEITQRHSSQVNDQVLIDSEFINGFTVDGIVDQSKEEDVQMVVMGATGSGKTIKKIFGSISTEVARRSECPIILVPESYQKYRFSKMGLALESNKMNKSDLRFVQLLVGRSGAQLEIVTVTEPGEDAPIWDMALEQMIGDKSIKGKQIYNDDVLEGLEEYCKGDVDLIMMTTKKRNVFENIFHKSVTKNMSINSEIPLMILHHKCTCEHGGACCKKFKEVR